ncbi:C40 family peptidase [Streptomyces sp. NPDC053048]|uniref:C40 family peptidase n=1 Tax=Streptomyces sp. NPDC053048 TaxID=3365694 RepID=UPI0037D32308
MPEEIPGEGARRRRGAMRAALLAAVGAAAIAGPGVAAGAVEPPEPGPGLGADTATREPDGDPAAVTAAGVGDGVDDEVDGLDALDGFEEQGLAGLADLTDVADLSDLADLADPGDAADTVGVTELEPALAYALRHLGDPYRLGGAGPRRWDCSGLVQRAYGRAGVRLPRVAADQYRATRRIPRSALRRGDLVFWSTNGRASGVHHVAIYMGGGRYIEAARPGTRVRVSTFAYYNPQMYGRVTRSAGR